MKKLLSLLLTCLILTSSLTLASAEQIGLKGDVNSDGEVNIKDVLLLRQHLTDFAVLVDSTAADYNNDTAVDVADVLCLRQKLAGLENAETNIPLNYKNVLSEKIQVNQVAYGTKSVKIAKLSELSTVNRVNSDINEKRCYVVKAEDNTVVYSAVTSRRTYDSVSSRYVSNFDFSSVKQTGKYKIFCPNGYSYTFEIKDNPYKDVQNALITALYYNKCGVENIAEIVGEKYARGVCHSGDVPVYILNKLDDNPDSPTYKRYIQSSVAKASDFLYGLHDAGDYGRYTTPATQVVGDLLMTYEMYGSNADCTVLPGSTSDLLDEAKHEMKWLLSMQNKETGGVYWRIATSQFVVYGNRADQDHYFNTTGLYVSHETLKSTAAFTGAAALCARVYKDIDSEFASQCLKAAEDGYAYIKANMENPSAHRAFENDSEYPSVNAGTYGDNSQAWGEIWWAFCELFRTTGEDKYHNEVKTLSSRKSFGEVGFSYSYFDAYRQGGAGTFSYVLNPSADSDLKEKLIADLKGSADSYLKTSKSDKYNTVLTTTSDYQWGSNQIICVRLKTMAMVDYINGTNDYEAAIRDNVCYILGRNAVNKSYVTGWGSSTPKDICHSPSAYLRVKYNLYTPAEGFMVGGAYESGSKYQDHHDNYACNEVCVYWNSSAILAFGYIVDYDSK